MQHILLAALAISVQQGIVHAQTTVPLKSVDLGYATYQTDVGLDVGVTSFLGIRYAAAPIGDLRFRAPRPPPNIPGIQNASVQPDECFQGRNGINSTSPFRKRTANVPNEDCLFVNVHVPTKSTPDSNLPVFVWIHGGGFAGGSNGAGNPAQTFVHNSNGSVISVQMQYRLGFLAGQTVANDGVLNAGLLDQNMALQWVQKYISFFGGDPTKVTIHGESAGAGSVLQHIVAHGGNTQPPLFRAAMMSSPFLPFQYAFDDPISEEIYSMITSLTNCTDRTLACLRSVDAETLNAATNTVDLSNFFGVFTFVPVVDGTFIVERPTVTLKKKQTNSDVVLAITNSHEGDIFTDPMTLMNNNTTLAEYVAELFPRMNDSSIQQAVVLYSNIGLSTVSEQAAEVMGDSIFVCPAFYVLDAFGNSAWKGQFAIPPALHGGDLAYLFADASNGFPPVNNSDFVRAFQEAFFGPVIFLDPNVHLSPVVTPEWPSYEDGQQTMLFNVTDAGATNITIVGPDQALLKRCTFWNSLGEVNAQ
ncbi:alpha/beta-hydrolase [Vararia minispora EC-137]|uniref:Alpha/beta-hydrolase n=1 Tax=Vararia minispora EC-137 TaxID=1314806 RepID=A0ACB8QR92_9AGAM|nr:alpha/beta-hydrolase [Vararia minispora EC-137]